MLGRIFDPHHKRYQIKSIPAILHLLSEKPEDICVVERPGLIEDLAKRGVPRCRMSDASPVELVKIVVDYYSNQLQSVGKEGVDLSAALDRLKTARNKLVAHSEFIDVEQIDLPTWQQCEWMTDFALDFVGVVGFAFLSTVYVFDSGENSVKSDAQRSSVSLQRLLDAAINSNK